MYLIFLDGIGYQGVLRYLCTYQLYPSVLIKELNLDPRESPTCVLYFLRVVSHSPHVPDLCKRLGHVTYMCVE